METTSVTTDRWKDEEDVVEIYNDIDTMIEIYYSDTKRNKTGSFLQVWMDLESVIQSEVSQKEKKKYCYINAYYVESREMVQMNIVPGQE